MKNTIVLFNPMPVKHLEQISTTSQQVPLVNVPLSLLALARMVRDDFNVKIFNAVVDSDYEKEILEACRDALCFAVSSMTCYQIRDGINVCENVKKKYLLCQLSGEDTILQPRLCKHLRTLMLILLSGDRANSRSRRP